jgi:large subunit ribosomal protein L24
MLHIKKDDTVMITVGKDRGKTGKVLRVFPKRQRALVEKLNLVKKAKRRTQQDQQGGFIELEAPIHVSNLMLVDKKTNKPARFSMSILKDGSKIRVSKTSGENI